MIEIEKLVEALPPPASGLHEAQLLQIAADIGVLQQMADNESRTVVVDYTPPNAEAMVFVDGDPLITPIEPFVVQPIRITYTLEDQMFGGDLYFTLTADGHALFRPIRWVSFEDLSHHVLKAR